MELESQFLKIGEAITKSTLCKKIEVRTLRLLLSFLKAD
jgi:hypothetical protein